MMPLSLSLGSFQYDAPILAVFFFLPAIEQEQGNHHLRVSVK